jgi:hypothetical protein
MRCQHFLCLRSLLSSIHMVKKVSISFVTYFLPTESQRFTNPRVSMLDDEENGDSVNYIISCHKVFLIYFRNNPYDV